MHSTLAFRGPGCNMPNGNSYVVDESRAMSHGWAMAKRVGQSTPRPTRDSVLHNIKVMLADTNTDQKELFTAIGMSQPTWSKHWHWREFSLEELAAIADFFAKKKKRPLRGWPFLSYSDSLEFDALKGPGSH